MKIYNKGNMTVNGNFSFSGSMMINEGTLTVTGTFNPVQNLASTFTNYGTVNSKVLQLTQEGTICLQDGSTIDTDTITGKNDRVIITGSGGCIHSKANFMFAGSGKPFLNSGTIGICLGRNVPENSNWGSGVNYQANCTSCGCPLKVSISPSSVCAVPSATFTANARDGSGTYTYKWYLNSVLQGETSENYTLTPPVNGTVLKCVVEDVVKACKDSANLTVTVTPLPAVTLTNPPAFCEGSLTTEPDKTLPGYTINWTAGAAPTVASLTAVGSPYTFTYTVTDGNSCTGAQQTYTVIVNPLPTVTLINPPAFCEGTLTTEPDKTLPGYTINWTAGSAPTVASLTAAGSPHTFTYTVTDGNSCTGLQKTYTVTVNPLPTVTLTDPPAFCEGTLIPEPDKTLPGYTINWTAGSAPTVASLTTVGSPHTFTYTVTDGNSCTGTQKTYTVTVNPLPTVTLTDPPAFCEGSLATEPDKTLPGYTINWTAGSAPTVASLTAVGSPYTFTYTVTDGNSCTGAQQTYTVIVNPLPTVTLINPPAFCEGTLTSEPDKTLPGYTINWTAGAAPTVASLTAAGSPHTFTYTVTDGNSCTGAQQTYTANVNTLPTVTLTDPPAFCEGTLTTEPDKTLTGYIINWISGSEPTVVPLTVSGSPHTFAYTVTDGNGCTGPQQIYTVEVNLFPTVTLTNPPAFCEGSLAAEPDKTFPGYTINWTAGSEPTIASLTAAGSPHTFTYTVTDGNSCTGPQQTYTVTVNPLPTVMLTDPPAFCEGTLTTEPDKTLPGYTINWTTGTAPTVASLTAAGSPHTFTYTVTDGNSCTGPQQTYTVTVNALPTVTLTNPPVFCEGSLTTEPDKTLPGYIINWTAGAAPTVASLTAAGSPYTFTYTVTDGNSCTGQQQIYTVTVNPLPTVALTNPPVFCEGSLDTELDKTLPGYTINWTAGSEPTILSLTASGSPHTFTYTVTDNSNSCTGAQHTYTVSINPLPVLIVTSPPAVCYPETVDIAGTATGADTYSYYNDAIASIPALTTYDGPQITDYWVVGTTNGCVSDPARGTVAIYRVMKPDDIELSYCAEDVVPELVVPLTEDIANHYYANGFIWYEEGVQLPEKPQVNTSVTENTLYNYEVTQVYIIDELTCESDPASVSIYVAKKIEPHLIANAEMVKEGETVILTVDNLDNGYYEYEWYRNNVLYEGEIISGNTLTLLNYEAPYHFYVKVSNDYCETKSNIVFVGIEFEIPNIITPYSKNGKNEDFMTAKNGKPGYKVEIYNRYQQKIFEGDNGWDGTYRGQLAEPGTYYYRLFMRDGNIQKGTLEVAKF